MSEDGLKKRRKAIGSHITSARLRAGMSQYELSLRTNLNEGTIGRYERGLSSQTLGVLGKIARATDTNVGYLIHGASDEGGHVRLPSSINYGREDDTN